MSLRRRYGTAAVIVDESGTAAVGVLQFLCSAFVPSGPHASTGIFLAARTAVPYLLQRIFGMLMLLLGAERV